MTISRFNRQVARNAKEFTRQLMNLMQHVEGSVSQVIRKACLDLWSNIVESTPVDTGRAKANWSISTEQSSEVYEAGREYNPHFSFDYNDNLPVIYIYNNLEYIEALEDGHSQQAPSGMVAVNLESFTNHLRLEALKAGYRVE